MTAVARAGAHLPTVADADFLNEVKVQLAPKATENELRFFAQVVAKTQLDPWSRQVYLIPRWDSRVKREVHRPQVSIDGLRLIAERTGKYDGQTPVEWCGDDGQWRDTWFAKEAPRAARVGVYKHGRAHPTYAVAHYDEYVVTAKDGKPSGLWRDKPRVMLAKCAEALALRKAFPQETSGLYTAEEMGRADAPPPVEEATPAAGVLPANAASPAVASAPQAPDAVAPNAAVAGSGSSLPASWVDKLRKLVEDAGFGEQELKWQLLALDVAVDGDPDAALPLLSLEQAKQLAAVLKENVDLRGGE